jgi:hypothetical protein
MLYKNEEDAVIQSFATLLSVDFNNEDHFQTKCKVPCMKCTFSEAQKHFEGALQTQTVVPTPLPLSTSRPYVRSRSRSVDTARSPNVAPVLDVDSVTHTALENETSPHSYTPWLIPDTNPALYAIAILYVVDGVSVTCSDCKSIHFHSRHR